MTRQHDDLNNMLVEKLGIRYHWPGSPGIDRAKCAVLMCPNGDPRIDEEYRRDNALASFLADDASVVGEEVLVVDVATERGPISEVGRVGLPTIERSWQVCRLDLLRWLEQYGEDHDLPEEFDELEDADPEFRLFIDLGRRRLMVTSDDAAWVVAPRDFLEGFALANRVETAQEVLDELIAANSFSEGDIAEAIGQCAELRDGDVVTADGRTSPLMLAFCWIRNSLNDREFEELRRRAVARLA